MKTKGIAWFRTHNQVRGGGKFHPIRHFQVCENGQILVIDLDKNQLRYQLSFGGTPISITTSTKEEFDRHVLHLSNTIKGII